jgi:hypothetical protein
MQAPPQEARQRTTVWVSLCFHEVFHVFVFKVDLRLKLLVQNPSKHPGQSCWLMRKRHNEDRAMFHFCKLSLIEKLGLPEYFLLNLAAKAAVDICLTWFKLVMSFFCYGCVMRRFVT